jgi:hypothetical protein
VAVVDLATNNALLNSVPWLLAAWGICMAVGLDSQIIAAWDRVGQAFRQRRWFILALYAVVGLALGYVGYIACAVFGFEHSMGYSESQALGMMGVNATLYQYQRAFLAVALVALSALNRYHAPQKSLTDERTELERELTLEPLRQRVREVKAVGAVNLTKTVAGAAKGKPRKPTPPTGGTPSALPVGPADKLERPDVLRLPNRDTTERKAARVKLTLREQVFRALDENADLSGGELARKFRKWESTCSRYKGEWVKLHAERTARVAR